MSAMIKRLRRTIVTALVVCITLAVLTYGLLEAGLSFVPGRHIPVTGIRPESGLAYVGGLGDPNLSDHEQPTRAVLFLIEDVPGGFLHRLSPVMGGSYFFEWLTTLVDVNYPGATHTVSTRLGPAHALHDDIRKSGEGRYSVWHGSVYFSLPPNKHSTAHTRLELVDPLFPALADPEVLKRLQALAGGVALAAAGCLVLVFAGRLLGRIYQRIPLVKAVIPGAVISLIMIGVIAVGAELFMRLTDRFPKSKVQWPLEFSPAFGWNFRPGAEVSLTNGLNYWAHQRANSLGFLDWEPVVPKPMGMFRILLVGDSFVEAAQIEIKEKMQSVLAQKLREQKRENNADVVAFGFSGTGQSNQLPWYALYKDRIKPDLVVLFFVNNDFADNSPILESIRNGWSADHSPRLFFRRASDGSCEREPIDPDWKKYLLKGGYTERLDQLRQLSPEYSAMLKDWEPTENDAARMDFVFYRAGVLPRVFEEAIELTRCSFAEWKAQTAKDGIPLVVVLAENVTAIPNGQLPRITALLNELNIPWLDLSPEFAKRGDVEDSRFKFDGHWTPTGHKWAADALFEFLKAKKLLGAPAPN